MAKKRVANVLIETLVAAGVKRVYGLVGDSTASPIRFVHGKFSLIEQEPSMPPMITFEQATGFGMFILKAFARLICDRDVTRHRWLWL
jgi:hypothetical protein